MRQILLSLALLTAACATTPNASVPPLAGTTWAVAELRGAQPNAPRRQTLTFSSDGHISGNGGCNGFGGDYTQTGAQLRFERIIHTMMACLPNMGSEQAYLDALEAVRSGAVDGDTLTLKNSAGATLVRLTRTQPEGS